jgi:hypothetical protein
MRMSSVIIVLYMPPRLYRGCGSSCQCLRCAAYAHILKQALCHILAGVAYFFILLHANALTCLIYYTYGIRKALPKDDMPAVMSGT